MCRSIYHCAYVYTVHTMTYPLFEWLWWGKGRLNCDKHTEIGVIAPLHVHLTDHLQVFGQVAGVSQEDGWRRHTERTINLDDRQV